MFGKGKLDRGHLSAMLVTSLYLKKWIPDAKIRAQEAEFYKFGIGVSIHIKSVVSLALFQWY